MTDFVYPEGYQLFAGVDEVGMQTGACFVAVRNLKAGDRNLCSVERLLLLGMNTEKHIQRKSHPACRMAFFIVFLIYLSR